MEFIKTYRGLIDPDTGEKKVDIVYKYINNRTKSTKPLPHLMKHSPTGLNWGYEGSGPADLARSIIGDATGFEDPPSRIYQKFKRDFVAKWEINKNWLVTEVEILEWIKNNASRFLES